ncbi:MAG TPA: hypothetical protein VIJ65_00820 [Acidobacteriaceae bacterium]
MSMGPSNMAPSSTGRMVVALAVIGILALLVWRTIDPGKTQQVAWLLLGFFAVRVLIGWRRARKMNDEQTGQESDRLDV